MKVFKLSEYIKESIESNDDIKTLFLEWIDMDSDNDLKVYNYFFDEKGNTIHPITAIGGDFIKDTLHNQNIYFGYHVLFTSSSKKKTFEFDNHPTIIGVDLIKSKMDLLSNYKFYLETIKETDIYLNIKSNIYFNTKKIEELKLLYTYMESVIDVAEIDPEKNGVSFKIRNGPYNRDAFWTNDLLRDYKDKESDDISFILQKFKPEKVGERGIKFTFKNES